MKALTPAQLTKIHILLNETGLKAQKEDIVSGFSSQRTTTTKELFIDEATALIQYLTQFSKSDASAEKMRRNIIRMAHELGWKRGDGSIDMKAVNGWCEKFGYGKKKLNSYNVKELPKLVTQFEQGPYNHFIKNL